MDVSKDTIDKGVLCVVMLTFTETRFENIPRYTVFDERYGGTARALDWSVY